LEAARKSAILRASSAEPGNPVSPAVLRPPEDQRIAFDATLNDRDIIA
jgi:hypothetical protein